MSLATRAAAVPEGKEWLHEPKLDGYRIQCHAAGGRAHLLSRNGLDWTTRFPAIATAAAQLSEHGPLVLDGEIVMPRLPGLSSFQSLQRAIRDHATEQATYWVFDLLRVDDLDLRPLPLSERRDALSRVLATRATGARIRQVALLRGTVSSLLTRACARSEEGVISKRRDAPYVGGRSRQWLKIKCGEADEFVIVGYTEPRGSRAHLGALLLATRLPGPAGLQYAGRVGTGMNDAALKSLVTRLRKRSSPPRALRVITPLPAGVRWVAPELVVSVSFAEWTSDGLLRQASFDGVREDKRVKSVTRETAGSAPRVRITHEDRVVFKDSGITKRQLADYHTAVAPVMLPHLADRPLSLLRCPEGVPGKSFFQKHWPSAASSDVRTVSVDEADGSSDPYAVANSVNDLIALVQMNAIEIHPWGSRSDALDRPDRLVLDLDPGLEIEWVMVCEAARRLRDVLAGLGLKSWVKLTGGKGLHVMVPLSRVHSWDQVSQFSQLVAMRLMLDAPDVFVVKASKAARERRIFIDWLRNSRGATAVAPWSVRARPGAPVAMPIAWDELTHIPRGDYVTVPELMGFLRTGPDDAWGDVFTVKQRISRVMVEKLGVVTR